MISIIWYARKTARRFSVRIVGRGERPELRVGEVAAPEDQWRPVGAAVVLHFDHEVAIFRQDNAVAIERKNLSRGTGVRLYFELNLRLRTDGTLGPDLNLRLRTDGTLGAEQRRTGENLVRLFADDPGAGVQDDQIPDPVPHPFHPNSLRRPPAPLS